MTQEMLGFCSSFVMLFCIALYDTVALMYLFKPRTGRNQAAALLLLSSVILFIPVAMSAGSEERFLQFGIVFGVIQTILNFYLLCSFFEGRFWEKVIWLSLRDMLDPANLTILLFSHYFPGVDFTDAMARTPRELWLILLMELVTLLLRGLMIWLFVYLHKKMRLSAGQEKVAGLVCLIGYLLTGAFLLMRIMSGQVRTRAESTIPFLIYSIAVGVAVKVIFDALEKSELTSEVRELEKQKQAQYDLFMARLKADEETRRLRHDIKGHIAVLETLLQKGEYEHAENYLREFGRQQSLQAAQPPRMENAVAGALIADKYLRCQKENISFTVDGNIEKNVGITDVDLVCLLSNMLDNAIESCLRLEPEQRRIYLKLTQRAGCLFIRIENSKTPESVLRDGHLRSTSKKDSSRHGFGRLIMLDAVKRYDGTVDLKETEDTFSAVVMLQPKKTAPSEAEPLRSE